MLNVLLIVTTISANSLNADNLQFNRVHAGEYSSIEACEIAGDAITEQIHYKVPVDEAGRVKTMPVYTNQTYRCVSRHTDD